MAHVVHIGYPKTASSWLQQAVFPRLHGVRSAWHDAAAHGWLTELAHAPEGRFDAEGFRSFVAEQERRDTRPLLFSEELLSGEVFSSPGTWRRSLARLQETLPGAKILVFVRRQSELLAALYAQYVLEGGFASHRRLLEQARVAGWELDWAHLEYDRLVERYAVAFGRERVRVLPYEFLRERPLECVAELAEYCGAEGYEPFPSERVNRSISPRSLAVLRRGNRLIVRARFNAHPLLGPWSDGQRLALFLRFRVDPLLRRLGLDSPARVARAFERAAARYADSNRRLAAWVGHPLDGYGYPGLEPDSA